MSFFSDLGSIAKELIEVRDEITSTVKDAAVGAVSSVTGAQSDVAASLHSTVSDITALRDSVSGDISAVKDEIVTGAKETLGGLTDTLGTRDKTER